jgi:hypothetical protein
MRSILKYTKIAAVLGVFALTSCEANFDKINENPNQTTLASPGALFSQTLWNIGFNDYDVWYGGRQTMVAAQQWAQRNYTSEDRYSFRANVMDGFFRNNYIWMSNLQTIIALNTDPTTKESMATLYGDNKMQIACAEVVKCWVFQLLTDSFGDIPYNQALDIVKYSQPSYDSQKVIYDGLIAKLKQLQTDFKAVIAAGGTGFSNGDLLFRGDLNKWVRFSNSLRLRLALRASSHSVRSNGAPDPVYIAEANSAIADGVLSSNADNAQVNFSSVGVPNEAPIYNGYYTGKRNDFTMTANFVDLVKGNNITTINYSNPFHGFVDPRWSIFRGPNYATAPTKLGMPYGLPDAEAQGFRTNLLSYSYSIPYANTAKVIRADFPSTLLDYPTVCFMISEVKGWDADYFQKGILASMLQWGADTTGLTANYINPILIKFNAGNVEQKKEMVITQKYIHLYMQAHEAWTEYRRTGYPKCLVKPGQITYGTITFEPVSGNESGSDVVARFKYPTSEYTLNKKNVNAALEAQGISPAGGDAHAVRMWWNGSGKQ